MAEQALPDPPDGRFLVAFNLDGAETFWTWEPEWTRLDDHPNLVTSYTIDRGRQYELDRTDTGRAVVEIADPDGILDPTNASGPYHGKIEPLRQAMLNRRNPITGEWKTRFRGWIEQYDYSFHPSQQVNMLTIQLVDIFEILAAIEMQPGEFGYPPPSGSNAEIYFEETDSSSGDGGPRLRMRPLLEEMCDIPPEYIVLFSGNVDLWETSYSAGESVLEVCADTADAEFPGIGNIYTDRYGRFTFHGRLAKFTPEDIYTDLVDGTLPYRWDWHTWDVGDGTAVRADPAGCAQIREFAFDRGLSKVINSAAAYPAWSPRSTTTALVQLNAAELNGQPVKDTASQRKYGIRSWTMQSLQTMDCNLDNADALVETKRMAQFYLDNYKQARNRVTAIGFRSIGETTVGAAITWELLTKVDISDLVFVTVGSPGGGGFALEPFYVEGVHEEARMLTPDMDDVTLHLDLSPRAYYDSVPPAWLP